MARARLALALALLLSLPPAVAACDGGGGGDPTAAELYGLWANEDAGTTRVFRFAAELAAEDATAPDLAGATDVYRLYLYPTGAAPAEVQRGTYRVAYGRLVTSVTWADDPAQVGRDFGNDLLAFDGDSFTLESASAPSGRRVFTRVTALP